MAKPGFEPRKYGPRAHISNYSLVLGSFHLQTQICQSLDWSLPWCWLCLDIPDILDAVSLLDYGTNTPLKCLPTILRRRQHSLWLQEAHRLKRHFYEWISGMMYKNKGNPALHSLCSLTTPSCWLNHFVLWSLPLAFCLAVMGCLVLNDRCVGQGSDRKQIVGTGCVAKREFSEGTFTEVWAGLREPVRDGEAPETNNSKETLPQGLEGQGEEVVYPTWGRLEPWTRERSPHRNSAIEECSHWSHGAISFCWWLPLEHPLEFQGQGA